MMKKVLGIIFFIAVISVHSQEWTQNNEPTKVSFKIKNFGVNVDGDFSSVDIQTNLNTNALSESYIKAKIQVKSISTGIQGRDKHILKEGYFDESNHKLIEFESVKIEKKANGAYQLNAKLTIKQITKEMKVPLEISETEKSITIRSNFIINRRDFKIGGGSFIMSKKVKIQVVYSGTR